MKTEPTLPTHRCQRCGHDWHPRTNDAPTVCPRCKSPYWNRARKINLVFFP